MKRVIITGCPRSGTRRLQAAFGQVKADAGWEKDATLSISAYLAVECDNYRGHHEPYWNREWDELWHVVRNPLDCIASMAARVSSSFWVWQIPHTGLHPASYARRREFAAHFWVRWNQELSARRPDWRFRIEDLEGAWPLMWKKLGEPERPFDPRGAQYTRREQEDRLPAYERLTYDEIKSWSPSLHDDIRRMAEAYGYEETT